MGPEAGMLSTRRHYFASEAQGGGQWWRPRFVPTTTLAGPSPSITADRSEEYRCGHGSRPAASGPPGCLIRCAPPDSGWPPGKLLLVTAS